MSLIPSKTRIVLFLVIFLSALIFIILGLFAVKSKQMIIENRISTLTFNLGYFKSLESFTEMYDKIEDNTENPLYL